MNPPVIEWLNENALRNYPFTVASNRLATNGYLLDNGLVLDLNLIILFPQTNNLFLLQIVQSGTSYTFTFTASITFTVTANTGIQYILGTNNSYLVVNTNLLGNLPAGTTTFNSLIVEPALIYEFHDDWIGVQQIQIGNCYQSGGVQQYGPLLPLVSTTITNLTGIINLYEGYNFGINFNNNLINLTAGDSSGIPLSCTDQFLDSSNNDCSSIVSYINGAPPDQNGNFVFSPGTNINIVLGSVLTPFYDSINTAEAANNHSLFVGFTFSTQDLCQPIAVVPIS